MSMPLQLVFFGELIEGFGIDEVRRNLAQSFKLGDEQLDRMFGGSAVVLKRNLADDEATRYVAHLATLGARAQMRPMPGAANTPTFKVDHPPTFAPLPTLIESDGPRDTVPFAADPIPTERWRSAEAPRAEAIVPLRAAVAAPASFASTPASSASTPASSASAPAPFASVPAPFASVPPSFASAPPSLASAAPPAAFTSAAAPFAPPAASPYPHAPALPLTIEPIQPRRAEVTCPKCNERQPMTLLCRNCTTNLEMALAARADDQAQSRAERVDAIRARHGLPPSDFGKSGTEARGPARLRAGADDPPPLWGVGWDGRIGRLNYATGYWAISAAMALVDVITYRLPVALGAMLGALAGIAAVAMLFRQTALRFHDRGHSGWWNLLGMLPLLLVMVALASPRVGMRLLIPAGLVLLGATLYLLFFPGDEDGNAYGSTPREGSGGALLASIIATLALGHFAPADSALGGRLRNIGSQDDAAVVERLRSGEAKRAYMTEYLLAGDQKAFAASPDGSWGWIAEARSDDAAMTEALGTCEKHRPATQRPCELVSVNGRPVGLN